MSFGGNGSNGDVWIGGNKKLTIKNPRIYKEYWFTKASTTQYMFDERLDE